MTEGPAKKVNRIFGVLLGAAVLLFGLLAVVQRSYESSKYGQVVDLGPCHSLIGIAIAAGGAYLIHLFLKMR